MKVFGRITHEYLRRAHTPDYINDSDWIINPDVSGVDGIVDEKYWKDNIGSDVIVEMSQAEKDAVDAAEAADAQDRLEEGTVNNMALPGSASQSIVDFLEANPIWTDSVSGLSGPMVIIELLMLHRELLGNVENPLGGYTGCTNNRVNYLETILSKGGWFEIFAREARYIKPQNLLIYYGGPNAFNSSQNSWNNELVAQDMAKYNMIVLGDGIPDLKESGTHTGSNNESVLTDSSKSWSTNEWIWHRIYNITDGSTGGLTANTSNTATGALSGGTDNDWDTGDEYEIYHPDYVNVQTIIDRVKVLNPDCKIFGYVSVNNTIGDFQTKVDNWDDFGVDGIFFDEAGYDYGSVSTNGRVAFNSKVDYVHGKTNAKICFVNAWNMDNIIGTENDASYPNTTYNSGLVESNLVETDWYLLESSPINTSTYSGTGGYQSATDWITRSEKAKNHRITYNINLAAVGVINNDNSNGQDLFDFGYIAALMYSLEAFGTSDTYYGSNGAVEWWDRPDISNIGVVSWKHPSVSVDVGDSDVYWRYVQFGRFSLDFSSGAQDSDIDKW